MKLPRCFAKRFGFAVETKVGLIVVGAVDFVVDTLGRATRLPFPRIRDGCVVPWLKPAVGHAVAVAFV